MELKELTISDREAITELFLDVFMNEPWNDDWSDRKQLYAYITELVGQECSLTLGYYDGDKLIGLSMGHIKHWYQGTEYFIDEFCVDRQYQGKGIGSSFMDSIEDYLRNNEVSDIFLLTERNVPAYEFYLHRGFREMKNNVSLSKNI